MRHDTTLHTRDIGTALDTRDAIPRPTSYDAERNTIEATIASNAPVERRDQAGTFQEILSPAGLDVEASRGVHVLDAHRQDGVASILGVLEALRVEGDEVVGTIRLSARPELAATVADIRSGVIRSLSIGYRVAKWADAKTNGIRTKTATAWTIHEVSFVPVPADRNARTRTGRAGINQQIRELGRRAGVAQRVIDDLIDTEADVDTARAAVLAAISERSPVIMTRAAPMDDPAAFVRAAGEGLFARVSPSFRPSPEARAFAAMTVADIGRECLRRSGISVAGLGAAELVTRALHTTSDFALILADTVGRSMRAAYAAAPSALRPLGRQATVPDFRARSRLMLDSADTLELVNETGEFRYGSMDDSGESYRIRTFGKIFAISRQALVNDDVGAFVDIPRRLGQNAAAFEASFLVDLLLGAAGLGPVMADGQTLFHSTHGNVAGSGGAPAEATLSAARLAMRRQTSPRGAIIDIVPTALVVPPDLETASEKLLTQIQATTTDDANPFARLSLIVEPRLTSTTRSRPSRKSRARRPIRSRRRAPRPGAPTAR